jgi:hypothetical protein
MLCDAEYSRGGNFVGINHCTRIQKARVSG